MLSDDYKKYEEVVKVAQGGGIKKPGVGAIKKYFRCIFIAQIMGNVIIISYIFQ